MEITVGKLKVVSDGMCWTIYDVKPKERGKHVGDDWEKPLGHYPFLSTCFEAILERDLQPSDAKSISDLIRDVKYLKARFEELKKEEIAACVAADAARYGKAA